MTKYSFTEEYKPGELGPGEMMVQPMYPVAYDDGEKSYPLSIPLHEVLGYRKAGLRHYAEDPKVSFDMFEYYRDQSLAGWALTLVEYNKEHHERWRVTPEEFDFHQETNYRLNENRLARRKAH